MKEKYETPSAEKLEFNYSETVVASGKTQASKGPLACAGGSGKTHASMGPAACGGGIVKTHASKGPAMCA